MSLASFAVVVALGFVPIEVEKPDAQAQKAAEQFCQAIKARKLADLMKIMDTPFLNDGRQVLRQRDELEKRFADIIAREQVEDFSFKVVKVTRFADAAKEVAAPDLARWKGVLAADDRLVHLEVIVKGSNKKERLLLGVRLRKGTARVVGFRD